MIVKDLAQTLALTTLCGDGSENCDSVYCCDLLSVVMGNAPANSVWVTVMGNVNAIAVALLTDVACIILADNSELDTIAIAKATQQNITVLVSSQDIFTTAKAVDNCMHNS